MSRPIDDALEACLAAIDSGTPAAEVLADWPDPAERESLAPLIAGATALGELPPMDAGRRAELGAELARVEHALYPPPAGGPLAGIPRSPLLVAAVIGAGILGWMALGGRPAAPIPEEAPRANALPRPEDSPGARAPGGSLRQPVPGTSGISAPRDGSANPGSAVDSDTTPDARAGSTGASAIIAGEDPSTAATSSALRGSDAASGRPDTAGSPVNPDAAPPDVAGTPGFVEITGKVVDPAGRGIPGAVVSAFPLGAAGFYVQRTEADGTYRLRLRPGSYVFQAEADGFAARWYGGAVRRGDAAVVDVTPERPATGIDFTLEPTHNTSHDPDTSLDPAELPASAAGELALGGQ